MKKEIIENENIYFMKKVKQEFINVVARVEDADASNYRTFRLKERLQKRFPQLVFHVPKERNKSEVVFAECINTGNVAESYLNQDFESSQSEMETEDDDKSEDHERFKSTNDAKKATLKELYNAALTLRDILHSCTASWYENWPPLGSEIIGENVRKLVPPLLFNFATWLLGFSDEPEESEYVNVEENVEVKVFSVCQDLIYICNKGRIQTPKSLALAMAVRQISGCSSLIVILNGLGHCVSLPSTMAYDSAIAQSSIDLSNIIPRDFVPNECVNLIYDNIDFGEEITKQTHVTNGIITQKVKVQKQATQTHTTVINKKQRTVKVPTTDIVPYSVGPKKTPTFRDMQLDEHSLQIESNNEFEQKAYKTDLAYILTKMVCSMDESPLPGWTGFNTMLDHKEIQDVSRVGYLPVINAPPTEYSTINTILQRSKDIADKLELKYAVLVFGEAVYAKIQHVRWKEPIFFNRFVVRLGEFHTIMSFLSAISKVFEDGGLKVIYVKM